MLTLYLWFAGVWAILAKMTIAGLVIAGLLFIAFVPVTFVPAILRKWALYAAALVIATTVAYSVGVHDESARCVAKTVVIHKQVTKVVKSVTTPKSKAAKDPWDNPNN